MQKIVAQIDPIKEYKLNLKISDEFIITEKRIPAYNKSNNLLVFEYNLIFLSIVLTPLIYL